MLLDCDCSQQFAYKGAVKWLEETVHSVLEWWWGTSQSWLEKPGCEMKCSGLSITWWFFQHNCAWMEAELEYRQC